MAKNLNMTMLFDVYGQLLTEKQRDVIKMYYDEDLSLAEISEEVGISRQAVLASIKQGEKHLIELENELCLVKRFETINEKITKIRAITDSVRFEGKEQVNKLLEEIRNEI